MSDFVCPMPMPWNRIYQSLKRAYERRNLQGPPPPIPLILAGWNFSNDMDKHIRWQATLEWAEKNGLKHLIPILSLEQQYRVTEFTTYDVGLFGGFMEYPWNLEPREAPTREAVDTALEKLRKEWDRVAGPDLAGQARPQAFTGKKFRRLLVTANPAFTPPWGGWKRLARGEKRGTFTRFRQAVNDAIQPLEVDHIDFDTSNWATDNE